MTIQMLHLNVVLKLVDVTYLQIRKLNSKKKLKFSELNNERRNINKHVSGKEITCDVHEQLKEYVAHRPLKLSKKCQEKPVKH